MDYVKNNLVKIKIIGGSILVLLFMIPGAGFIFNNVR